MKFEEIDAEVDNLLTAQLVLIIFWYASFFTGVYMLKKAYTFRNQILNRTF